jgi:hypothetical protein
MYGKSFAVFLIVLRIFTIERIYINAEFADDLTRDIRLKIRDLGHWGRFFTEAENIEGVCNHLACVFVGFEQN